MKRATKVTGISAVGIMAAALIGGVMFLNQDPKPNVDPSTTNRAYAGDIVAIPDGVFRVPSGLSVAFIDRGVLPEQPCGIKIIDGVAQPFSWQETLKYVEKHGKPASDLCALVVADRRWSFHPCLKEVPRDPADEADAFALRLGMKTKYVPEARCEAVREKDQEP